MGEIRPGIQRKLEQIYDYQLPFLLQFSLSNTSVLEESMMQMVRLVFCSAVAPFLRDWVWLLYNTYKTEEPFFIFIFLNSQDKFIKLQHRFEQHQICWRLCNIAHLLL